jgi:hypothetical protein
MHPRVAIDPKKLEEAVRQVERRVAADFPGSGLAALAHSLTEVAADTCSRGVRIRAPHWGLRIAGGAGLIGMAGALIFLLRFAQWPADRIPASDLAQGVESVLSTLILMSVAGIFLVTLERRVKRNRALEALHELRVMAHVIDLHQLTKDPGRGAAVSVANFSGDPATAPLSPTQIGLYLNECGDLLALLGKVAAWYVQGFQDAVVLQTVNEIEELVNGLSRKIWQKLTLLDQMTAPRAGDPALPTGG